MIEKITVMGLFTLIVTGEVPNRFIWDDKVWKFDAERKDYYTKDRCMSFMELIVDEHSMVDMLSQEIELIETLVEPAEEDLQDATN